MAGPGAPTTYTVSKVAVNAYTRILQKQVEERGYPDIVVNSLRPGSQHSKVPQEGQVTVSASDAASSVVSTALLPHPCSSPRGQFIWHDLSVVDWSRGELWEILEQEQSHLDSLLSDHVVIHLVIASI